MKQTALNQNHKNLNAKMVEFAGYEMPVQYSGVINEHMAVRNNVGIFDVSHMGQFVVKGNYAEDLIQHVTSNDVSKLSIGQAQYSTLVNEKGGIIDDLIVYKIADKEYMLVVNAANIDKDWEWIQKVNHERADNVEVRNESEELSLIAVQGPKAQELVQRLTDTDLSKIKFYHFEFGTVNGLENVLISNTGYTGSGGFELYMPNNYAPDIWEALMDNGTNLGIQACGLAARDTLRLEKGYCLYGNDINDETTPLEAGLGWITKLGTDFIGEQPIKEQKEKGVDKKLVGFVMKDRAIPRKDYKIVDNKEKEIGIVTSGTQSPELQKGIGMGYVQSEYSKPGTEIFIEIRNKNIPAEVQKLPFV